MVKFFKGTPTHNKNFGWAIKAMREGKKVSRKIWGDLYLRMVKVHGSWVLHLCNRCTGDCKILTHVLTEDVLAEDWGEITNNNMRGGIRVWPTTTRSSNSSSNRKDSSKGNSRPE